MLIGVSWLSVKHRRLSLTNRCRHRFVKFFLSRFGYQSESVLQLYQLPQFQPEQELLPQSIQRLEAQSLFNIN